MNHELDQQHEEPKEKEKNRKEREIERLSELQKEEITKKDITCG